MALPDGLLIAGAVVGLVGGVVGAATGADNIVTRIIRTRRAKRDAEMILNVEFDGVLDFFGRATAKYPVATARLSNHGKVVARGLRIEASTGFALIATEILLPDESVLITFPIVSVHDLPIDRLFIGNEKDMWAPVDTPYVVGKVMLSVRWRIDGQSDWSAPLEFSGDYSRPPLG